jgi:hypothetical protein
MTPPTATSLRVEVRAGLLALALVATAACGNKTTPLPPDLVRPQQITDLTAEPVAGGIRLSWSRPRETVGGYDMPDLDGVRISRASVSGTPEPSSPRFETIATIHLDDRERFSKARKMTYDDHSATRGQTYLYQVEAFTLDDYVSAPSSSVKARWDGAGTPRQ